MEILGYVLVFIIGTGISTLCLWGGMKITKVDGPIIGLVITSAICTLVGMIPLGIFSSIISYIVMCVLIYKFTNADRIWPDVILMVLVARVLAIFGSALILILLAPLLQSA